MPDSVSTISRRSVLAGLGAVTLSACSPNGVQTGQRRTIVIGAGLAGLAAAYELMQAGEDVRVFEQSDRAGGRVKTVRNYFEDGDTIELGGTEVVSSFVTFLDYCKQLNVDVAAVERSDVRRDVLLHEAGKAFSLSALQASGEWPIALTSDEQKVVPFGLLGSFLNPVATEIASVDRVLSPEFAHYDAMTLRELLSQRGASSAAIDYIDRTLNYNSVDTVSALGALRDQVRRIAAGRPTGISVSNGNESLPEAFAERLGDRIAYNHSLIALENGPDAVKLKIAGNNGTENLECDQLVVAIPFSALRHVSIDGDLAGDRRDMIENLPYTQISRTYLKTASRFWELDGPLAAIYTDSAIERFFDLSDSTATTSGLLLNWINGIGIDAIRGMDDGQRASFIVNKMRDLWPQAGDEVQQALSIDWGNTYCEGAYAHFAPGQVQRFANVMSRPEGRVHFAGEHTEFSSPGLEGALISGRRAAQGVLDSV